MMGVKQYVKKPVVIEAIQYTGTNIDEISDFMTGKHITILIDNKLIINTLEGDMKASINDYIIKGIAGEFYPCKPEIFENTYELIK